MDNNDKADLLDVDLLFWRNVSIQSAKHPSSAINYIQAPHRVKVFLHYNCVYYKWPIFPDAFNKSSFIRYTKKDYENKE